VLLSKRYEVRCVQERTEEEKAWWQRREITVFMNPRQESCGIVLFVVSQEGIEVSVSVSEEQAFLDNKERLARPCKAIDLKRIEAVED
jgi:hypothetical protein